MYVSADPSGISREIVAFSVQVRPLPLSLFFRPERKKEKRTALGQPPCDDEVARQQHMLGMVQGRV